jgi:penicillin amidase
MRRLLVKSVAALLVLAALAAAAGYHYLRRSLPQIDGTVTVAGLTAPLDIVRDADAIPHIFAASKRDGLFGLGYVHAQDRLWEMELQRRIGHGRLSEILGDAALPQDRFLRTVGFGRAARSAWIAMPDWAQADVNAYIAGINAFLAAHHGAKLPPEFTLLGFEPEPWTGPDVIVWVKMMAWDLSANYSFELLRDDLVRAVGPARMAELMPPYATNGLSIVGVGRPDGSGGAGRAGGSSTVARTALPSSSFALTRALSTGVPAIADFLLGGAATEGLGSNNWVVDGTLTASGKPMLANDPHLSARMPSTWYLAHVTGGDFEMIGATLPGAPAVALGRNRFIAWGATNVAADVEDLYRERIDPTGTFAEFRGAQEPIAVIPETIVVKGKPSVVVNVRVTRHGPLISDALNAMNAAAKDGPAPPPLEPLAFRWTALDPEDQTVTAFLKLNEARNWTDFTAALKLFVTPSQNFVYADVDGHIGYYAPGHIPVRASGDGSRPADGWSGEAEWKGWVPFDELPHLYDPPTHVIVTANHRPEPAAYPHLLGLEWAEPFRAQRILDRLAGRTTLMPDDFARIQADTISLEAKTLLPLMLAQAHPDNDVDAQAIALLRAWNFDARGDSVQAALFETWFQHLAPVLTAGVLGPRVGENYDGRYSFVSRFLVNTLSADTSAWCSADGTKPESCDRAVTLALRDGVGDLEQRLGGDMRRWRWDAVHHAVFPHQLGVVPMLRPLLNRSVPNGGDWSTVNVGASAADALYEQHSVPGYREIIDLSPANDSRFLDAVGESGHFLSPHYDDFLPDWHAVKHRKMRMDRADIERGALGTLRLTP